jgi:hypothetical protein
MVLAGKNEGNLNLRDEHNIPFPLIQTRFLELLKIDNLLLELILSVDDLLGWC